MAVYFVTAQKSINGETKDVFYVGTSQADGYIYFNDETMYRCLSDGSLLQLFYMEKQNWVITTQLSEVNCLEFSPAGILDAIAGIVGGGGSVSPNADVEAAVQWMIDKANTGAVTYSQAVRNLKNPDGWSYDCSSFVITGFYVGGLNANATYTGDMRAGFTALGFEWIPGSYFDSSVCRRGDILLNEALHTQVYIGNNQDVNCGSTPAGVETHSPDNYGRGWDGILRYAG